MAHAAAGRRGAPGDEADHRLLAAALGFVLEELRGVLLRRAADLADHDDRLGRLVGEKHLQHVDELGALDRIAADADRGGLAEAFLGGLEHRLVGQRAGARHDADLAGLEDVARHDADLAFAGRHHARAIRSDQPRFRAAQRALDLDHVGDRNAFGDADDQRDLGLDRLADRVGRAGRRHIDHAGVAAGLFPRFGHGVEHRQAEMGRAAFAGRGAADHLGAVGDRLLGMEGAVLAGEALADDFGVLVDEDGHQAASFTALTIFCAASSRSSAGGDVEVRLGDDLLAELDIGAFEPHHQRHLQADLLHRRDHAFGDDVALHDAAEDVDQNALHVGIGGDDLERRRDLLLGGAAADVEEVGRRLAVELDDVHGRHGEAGAVDHAADGAVERDVVEIVFRGLDLLVRPLRSGRAAPRCRDGGRARCRRSRSWRRGRSAGRPW